MNKLGDMLAFVFASVVFGMAAFVILKVLFGIYAPGDLP